jgi:hypothetical protein
LAFELGCGQAALAEETLAGARRFTERG